MKKFEFRLDSALRWRDTQLQIERGKLSALLAEEARLNDSLDNLARERSAAVQCLAKEQLFSLDLRSLSSYLVGAELRANILRDQIRKNSQLVNVADTRATIGMAQVEPTGAFDTSGRLINVVSQRPNAPSP